MQYILQDFEDTQKLADVLDRAGLDYSMHKVVPFIGELQPEPEIKSDFVIMFGSYSLWRYAEKHGLKPGVFRIAPYIDQKPWHPYLLNGPHNSVMMPLKAITELDYHELFFIRPVEDSKEIAGTVMSGAEICDLVASVNNLTPDEYINGSLQPDTMMIIGTPSVIRKEWRIWVIVNHIATYSVYKIGNRVQYINEIDDDVLEFANKMIALNPYYANAFVMDVCRIDTGELKIIETNCINAAGFYAADMGKIVGALEGASQG